MKLRLRMAPEPGEILSPRGLLVRAAILTALFMVCHAAGFREYTCFLCGMNPSESGANHTMALMGLTYVIGYIAVTVFVPILLIAAGILAVGRAVVGRTDRTCGRAGVTESDE